MAVSHLAFLLVGLLVVVVSWIIGNRLIVFFYVGLLLFSWGLFKMAVTYLTSKPTKVEERKTERRIRAADIVACPYCATPCYTTARYCHMCGGRLKVH